MRMSLRGRPSQVRRGRSDRPPGAGPHPTAHAQWSVLSASQTVVAMGQEAATLELDAAAVARLTAGGGVEHCAVEHDAAALVDGEHPRGTVARRRHRCDRLLGHGPNPSLMDAVSILNQEMSTPRPGRSEDAGHLIACRQRTRGVRAGSPRTPTERQPSPHAPRLQALSDAANILGRAAGAATSQWGTGRFFDFRNAGLNSFDW